jgi:ankyrin repeat protein
MLQPAAYNTGLVQAGRTIHHSRAQEMDCSLAHMPIEIITQISLILLPKCLEDAKAIREHLNFAHVVLTRDKIIKADIRLGQTRTVWEYNQNDIDIQNKKNALNEIYLKKCIQNFPNNSPFVLARKLRIAIPSTLRDKLKQKVIDKECELRYIAPGEIEQWITEHRSTKELMYIITLICGDIFKNITRDQIVNLLGFCSLNDPNMKTEYSETPLMSACFGNCPNEIIEILLNLGADPNIQDYYGETALMRAVEKNKNEIIQKLLDLGADPNIQDKHGKTALMRAVERNAKEAVETLIHAGADLDTKDKEGRTTLDISIAKGHTEILEQLKSEFLLRSGIRQVTKDDLELFNLERKDESFRKAIKAKNRPLVHCFLNVGIDLNKQHNKGFTPLMLASRAGDKKIAKLLLSKGVDPNRHTERGCTALEVAAYYGNEKIVKLLIQYGAQVNKKGFLKNRKTALIAAVREGHLEIAKMFINANADLNAALVFAAKHNKKEIIEFLLKYKTEVNGKNGSERALLIAAKKGHLEIAKMLIQAHTDPNAQDRYPGKTALMKAVESKNREMVQLLLEAGADFTIKDDDGYDAYYSAKNLHYSDQARKDILDLLESYGAKFRERPLSIRLSEKYNCLLGLRDSLAYNGVGYLFSP